MSYLCRCQKYEDVYSSEDLGRFYFQYQTEALPHGESVQSFCARNKVPYNIFSHWYRDTRSWIVEVTVDSRPEKRGTLGDAARIRQEAAALSLLLCEQLHRHGL